MEHQAVLAEPVRGVVKPWIEVIKGNRMPNNGIKMEFRAPEKLK